MKNVYIENEPTEWSCHFCEKQFEAGEVFETADEFAFCAKCRDKIAKGEEEVDLI